MTLGLGLGLGLSRGGGFSTASFVARMSTLLGGTIVGGFLPLAGDTTTSVCPWTGKVWTADTTMSLTVLGGGRSRSFVSATPNYLTTPDTANWSFGTGAADQALTFLALANVTDTAAQRTFFDKRDNAAAQREYSFAVTTTDTLLFQMFDQSAAVQAFVVSNAAITQGAFVLFSVSYDGSGGATAANGIALYQSGAVMANTPTNNAGYVAMENLTEPPQIGSSQTHTGNSMDGSIALLIAAQTNLNAAGHAAVAASVRAYFGVA